MIKSHIPACCHENDKETEKVFFFEQLLYEVLDLRTKHGFTGQSKRDSIMRPETTS